MHTLILIFAWMLVFIGVLGVILPALPGSPLVFAGLFIAAWLDGFARVGWMSLVVMFVLMIAAQVVDFLVTTIGAKRMGASGLAMTGAIIGTVVGIFFGIAGILFAPFVGAALGELYSTRNLLKAGKVGVGTWIGLVVGSVVRVALVCMMIGLYAVMYFF